MQKSKLIIICFTFLAILLFSRCTEEKTEPKQPEPLPDFEAIDNAKEWFNGQTSGNVSVHVDPKTKSSGTNSQSVQLYGKWGESQTEDLGDIKNVETPVFKLQDNPDSSDENCTSCLKSGSEDHTERSRTRFVIQTDEKTGKTRGFMMTVIPTEEYLASGKDIEHINYYNRGEDFCGLIVFNHLDGSFANAWRYKEGDILEGYIPQKGESAEKNPLKAMAQIEYLMCTNTYVSYGGQTSYVGSDCWLSTETVWYYEDHYRSSNDYSGSQFDDRTYSGGSGGSGSNNESGEYLPPIVLNDPSFVNTAADCVKQKLDQGNIINDLLAGFKLDKSQIDVVFTVAQLKDGINAKCEPIKNNNNDTHLNRNQILMKINKDHLSSPSIDLARTILHECFHAYIYGKIYQEELHNGLAPEPNFNADWKKYVAIYGDDDAQHNYMAEKYIEHLRTGLKEFFYLDENNSERTDFLNAVKDNSKWRDVDTFLECISWIGLDDTDAWDDFIQVEENQTNYSMSNNDFIMNWASENCK